MVLCMMHEKLMLNLGFALERAGGTGKTLTLVHHLSQSQQVVTTA